MAAPGGKAPDAFRTISEVGEDLSLPQHVLRFWETRFPAVRPLKRGGGRRYYRPDDVDLLKGIRVLLYEQGYTIKGVQRIIRDSGPRAVGAIGRGEAPPPGQGPAERDEREEDGPGVGPDGASPAPGDPAGRLRAVLAELGECRRILRALRSGDDG